MRRTDLWDAVLYLCCAAAIAAGVYMMCREMRPQADKGIHIRWGTEKNK